MPYGYGTRKGKLLETIAVPESPTNCAFAGPGSNVLYITGRKNVFRIRLRTKGCPLNLQKPLSSLMVFGKPSVKQEDLMRN
jgi:hypothetical protein